MGRMGMDHTARRRHRRRRCARCKASDFTRAGAARQRAVGIDLGQTRRLEKAEARIGRRDQEAVAQAHADVAGTRVHVAALEERAADAAELGARFSFGHGAERVQRRC